MPTLFAALRLPDSIIDVLVDMQKNVEGVRWSPPENMHITLGYFGLLSNEMAEVLDYELGKIRETSLDLKLESAGVFGGSRPHTLWLGLAENAALMHLHKGVRSAARRAKVAMEARKFTPHLSLAYMSGGVDLSDLDRFVRRHITYKSKTFLCDEFSLYSSNPQRKGPNIYVKEANYPLLG